MSKASSPNTILAIVTLSHAATHLYLGLMPVLYPAILEDLKLSYMELGLLVTGYSLAVSLPQVVFGFLRKYVLRRIILGIGILLLSFMNILSSIARDFLQLFIYRTISGIGSSPQHPLGTSYLVEKFPSHRRGRILGMSIAGANIGIAIAPFIASFTLPLLGWRTTLFLFSIPGIFIGAVYLLFIKEEASKKGESDHRQSSKSLKRDMGSILGDRNLLILTLLQLVVVFSFGATRFIPTYLVDFLGMNVSQGGLFFTILTLGSVLGPFTLGFVADRFGRKYTSIIIMLSTSLLLYLLPLSRNYFFLLSTIFILGLLIQSAGPILQAILGDVVGEEMLDLAYGFFFTVSFGLASFSPIIFGYLIDTMGFISSFTAFALVSGILTLPAFLIQGERTDGGERS